MSDHEHELDDGVAELLSALLDGALTPAERAEAEAWLDRSAAARAEYEALGRVRAGLRELPAVDPPVGFFDQLYRRSRPDAGGQSWWSSPAALVASGIATAAAWTFLGGAGGTDRLVPPIDDVQVVAAAPASLREVQMHEAPVDETVAVSTDGVTVTVLRQDGSVDWGDLPDGRHAEVDGSDVWIAFEGGPATVIAQRGDAVYTLVSDDLSATGLVALVDDLPDSGGDGLLDRARDACETLVDAFTWD